MAIIGDQPNRNTAHQVSCPLTFGPTGHLRPDASSAGALAVDGVMMLVYQGAKALEIWTGKKAPVDVMERAVREALAARRAGRG